MRVTIHTVGAEPASVTVSGKETILDALRQAGIALYAPCGGEGRCGRCGVLVKDSRGISQRLACQTLVEEDTEVFFEGAGSITIEGADEGGRAAVPAPANVEGAGCGGFAPGLAGLVGPFGAGIDIGTTTIVFYLVDIGAQAVVATSGCVNPQVAFGGDVLSRIQAAQGQEGLDALCSLLRASIDEGCRALCLKAGIGRNSIEQVYIVGNTVMEHFAAGLDPTPIGAAPFKPRSLFGDRRPLFMAEGSEGGPLEAVFAPAVAGYVGGDITAGLSITDIPESPALQLFIDIGTNGEMALGNADRIACCATAAGPAFEGAGITLGMPAMPGAVHKVAWSEEGFALQVIGGGRPVGVCGSGVLDAIACMLDAGIMDETGRILGPEEVGPRFAPCVGKVGGMQACLLDPEGRIYITQGDVREIQLAKAAVRAGIETLLEAIGAASQDIACLLLAGGFGMSIDPSSAARIGLYPPELASKVRSLGNAAGKGAAAALMWPGQQERVAQVARRCEYLELSTSKAFNGHYIEAMAFEE